ncbi:hypothetical protein D3C87_1589520 [compost metagenome]
MAARYCQNHWIIRQRDDGKTRVVCKRQDQKTYVYLPLNQPADLLGSRGLHEMEINIWSERSAVLEQLREHGVCHTVYEPKSEIDFSAQYRGLGQCNGAIHLLNCPPRLGQKNATGVGEP